MKPMNFPGRKNARRRSALERRKRELAKAEVGNLYAEWCKDKLRREIETIESRIVDDAVALATRTKKNRSASARVVG